MVNKDHDHMFCNFFFWESRVEMFSVSHMNTQVRLKLLTQQIYELSIGDVPGTVLGWRNTAGGKTNTLPTLTGFMAY